MITNACVKMQAILLSAYIINHIRFNEIICLQYRIEHCSNICSNNTWVSLLQCSHVGNITAEDQKLNLKSLLTPQLHSLNCSMIFKNLIENSDKDRHSS